MPRNHREPEPVASATLILYRTEGSAYRIYLLRRSRKSGFMAGTWVFPGGILDHSDLNMDFWLNRIDLDRKQIDKRFGWGEATERTLGYLIAAVRETFEEAGVLLVRHKSLEAETAIEFQAQCRNKTDAFEKLAKDQSLLLSLSSIRPWAYWITPEGMKKRYETRFFIAPFPSGSICRPDPVETPEGIWIHPFRALEENTEGRLPLSPPAVVTLHQMLSFETVSSLEKELRYRKWGKPIMQKKVCGEKGELLLDPWDPEYNDEKPAGAPGKLLKVGTPFSRMWRRDGFWLPVDLPTERQ